MLIFLKTKVLVILFPNLELMKHLIFSSLLFCLPFLLSAQFQIGTNSSSIVDPSRSNRNITFEVCYPADVAGNNTPIASGHFPTVVFGHGFGIAVSEYDIWCQTLAAKGYIFVLPTTEGSVFPFPNHEQFSLDMSFLIDYFISASSPFPNSIMGTTAVMGHSMGGGASWSVAANNTNVTTMITLAAAETNAPVSSIGAAPNIIQATLTISGSSDCVVQNGGAPIDMFNALPTNPYHVLVDIIGGSHCQFGAASNFSVCTLGELCGGFIPIADQHSQMISLTCSWFDFYLKGNHDQLTAFQQYVTTNESSLHNSSIKGTQACLDLFIGDNNMITNPTNTTELLIDPIPAFSYQGDTYIHSNSTVSPTLGNVSFYAATQIELLEEFEVTNGVVFLADIRACQ